MKADMDDDPLRLDRQVCFPVYAASNLINRLYTPALSEIGLTYPQYLVMLVLWEGDPQSVGDIGKRLFLNTGTLTPLLKRLESAGFIARTRDSRDERRVLVALTDKGREARVAALRIPQILAGNCDVAQSEGLRDQIRHLVEELARRVENTPEA